MIQDDRKLYPSEKIARREARKAYVRAKAIDAEDPTSEVVAAIADASSHSVFVKTKDRMRGVITQYFDW